MFLWTSHPRLLPQRNPWLIHVNVWQKPLQYCKVISLQLIKINGKNIYIKKKSQGLVRRDLFKRIIAGEGNALFNRENAMTGQKALENQILKGVFLF